MSPKSVLITGCSAGGIGAAVALALAQRGHHVFVTARNTSKIPEQLSLLSNVTILSLDVKSTESIISAAKAVSESGRGLDVLVNNAGAGYVAPVLDMDIRRAQDLFDTNVWGCIRTIQAFGDLLIASRGRVVNLCSIGGVVNMPWICRSGFSDLSGHSPSPLIACVFFCSRVRRFEVCTDQHIRDVASRAVSSRRHRCDRHGGRHHHQLRCQQLGFQPTSGLALLSYRGYPIQVG